MRRLAFGEPSSCPQASNSHRRIQLSTRRSFPHLRSFSIRSHASRVTRAGLVRQLGHVLGAGMMDEQVAYLASSQPATHPLAACFELLEAVPFSIARLRNALRAGRWKPSEIRRRAFPIEPDELRRLLGPFDGEPVTLLCTTLSGQRTVFIGKKVGPQPPGH